MQTYKDVAPVGDVGELSGRGRDIHPASPVHGEQGSVYHGMLDGQPLEGFRHGVDHRLMLVYLGFIALGQMRAWWVST